MPWEAWLTIGSVALMMLALWRNWAGPDTILLGTLTLLVTVAVFSDRLPTAREAMVHFGNEGLITIAVLFAVAQGMSQTGAMEWIVQPLLGRPRSAAEAQLRMMVPVAALSAFLNNTPIVAMFMPVISDWCRKVRLAPSKLFIPLSYAAMLGGMCTLIGTSTNLVVYGLVLAAQKQGDLADIRLGMFTIAAIGVPVAVIGVLYTLVASGLLPDRRAAQHQTGDAREYTVEMLVEPGSAVDGRSIEQAGLRHLPGVYLAEIERAGERIVAVGPEQILRGGDRLIFVGVVSSVVDLQKTRGLVPATNQVFKLDDPRPNRCLIEAVVSDTCPMVGRSIREGRFRTHYNAAVIAVHRNGERIRQKIGDIVLKPGDVLLMEAHPRFVSQQRNRRDFFLVSEVAGSQPLRHDRAPLAVAILAALVAAVTFTPMSLLTAALLAGGAMVLTRCLTMSEARNSVDVRVLLAIGCAMGVGQAMEQSGAAHGVAQSLLALVRPLGPYGILAGVTLVTMLFTSLINNAAAAVLVFPVARDIAAAEQLSFMPFVVAVMIAASAAFITPMGYQTNLMVYGPGGYRAGDYFRFGLPLSLLVVLVTVLLTPLIWPLTP